MKNVFMKVIRTIFSLTIFLFLVLVISHSTIKRSNDKLDELYNNARNYDERKILLHNTSISNANALAKRFNAEVRIANNGTFAVLTLLEGQTVKDIYEAKENNDVLEKLSLDYYARIADIEEEPRQVMPSSYIPSDDLYNQQTYLDYLNLGNTWKDTKGVDKLRFILLGMIAEQQQPMNKEKV